MPREMGAGRHFTREGAKAAIQAENPLMPRLGTHEEQAEKS